MKKDALEILWWELYGNLIWEENEASEITSDDIFQKTVICQQVQNVLSCILQTKKLTVFLISK